MHRAQRFDFRLGRHLQHVAQMNDIDAAKIDQVQRIDGLIWIAFLAHIGAQAG